MGFLPFELHKFGIFWNGHQPKGGPSLTHSPTWFGGSPSLTFHQPKFFREVPISHFSSNKVFRGVPISHFSSTKVFQRGAHLPLFIYPSFLGDALWKTLGDEKWEMGTTLKNLGWWKVRDGHPSKKLGLIWKVRDGHPPNHVGWWEWEMGIPLGDADSKKCQISVVQMAKKPWHTLINTRGCPSLAVISLGQAVVFNTWNMLRTRNCVEISLFW